MLVDYNKTANGGRMGSPGLEELKPVYPGETLSLAVEVVDKRVPITPAHSGAQPLHRANV